MACHACLPRVVTYSDVVSSLQNFRSQSVALFMAVGVRQLGFLGEREREYMCSFTSLLCPKQRTLQACCYCVFVINCFGSLTP
eukprot:1495856-Amphidinium_carterae.1